MRQDLSDRQRYSQLEGLSTEEALSEGLMDFDDLISADGSYSDPEEEELRKYCEQNGLLFPTKYMRDKWKAKAEKARQIQEWRAKYQEEGGIPY
ncbi:hypothetical protein [Crocosphaera sp.]|uniref:hypothetical protein n=1 Tax=Crocosphaera sp. TaxID=2729996 RepID=UPI00257BC728|nr:hypothetical protein [Crocosphaera sp.]NQZ64878.1 hypothetical protein [Crocosphaera sp.]